MVRASAVAVVLAAGLASCSAPVTGAPAAAARPRDVRVDGVDPCSLLTPAERAGLGLNRPPQYLPGDAQRDGELCNWRGDQARAVDTGVTYVTRGGIELFDTASGHTKWSRIHVRDYPALVITLDSRPEFCSVGIDIAPGQALNVQFSDDGRKPPIPPERLCADARQVADLVMGNLLSQR